MTKALRRTCARLLKWHPPLPGLDRTSRLWPKTDGVLDSRFRTTPMTPHRCDAARGGSAAMMPATEATPSMAPNVIDRERLPMTLLPRQPGRTQTAPTIGTPAGKLVNAYAPIPYSVRTHLIAPFILRWNRGLRTRDGHWVGRVVGRKSCPQGAAALAQWNIPSASSGSANRLQEGPSQARHVGCRGLVWVRQPGSGRL